MDKLVINQYIGAGTTSAGMLYLLYHGQMSRQLSLSSAYYRLALKHACQNATAYEPCMIGKGTALHDGVPQDSEGLRLKTHPSCQ